MPKEKYFNAWRNQKPISVLSTQPLPNPVVFALMHNDLWGVVRGIRVLSVNFVRKLLTDKTFTEMKKLLQLLCLMLLSIAASVSAAAKATASTTEDARLLAQRYLAAKKGAAVSADGVLTAASTADGSGIMRSRKVAKADFLAYNAAEGGFVLMAQNGGEQRVIGYGVEGSLSFDNMPEAMAEWMNEYRKALASASSSAGPARANTYPEPTVAPVSPLISTKWGQHEPFNLRCPKYNGELLVAGCTAVAMAQILNYYKSDNTGYDLLEYVNEGAGGKELSVDFTKIKYDWANMLDVYEEGKYTDEQADAVAKLMFEAGVSCKAKYDISVGINYSKKSTSAAIPFVGFDRYYNYNCELYYRDWTPTNTWMKVIQDELTAGRPILYSGANSTDAHAFVLDGIDEENNVHINWGWNGDGDGYYDVTFCHAPDYSKGFFKKQAMLVGLRPRTEAEGTYKEQLKHVGYNYHRSYKARTYYQGVTGNAYKSSTKYLITMCLTQNGEIRYLHRVSDLMPGSFPAYTAYASSYVESVWGDKDGNTPDYYTGVKVADGEYVIDVAYRPEGSSEPWTVLPARKCVEARMVVKDGKATYYSNETSKDNVDREMPQATILDIVPAAELIGKSPLYLTVTEKSDGDRIDWGTIGFYFIFTNKATGKVYKQTRYANIYPGECLFDANYMGLTETKTFGVLAKDDEGFAIPEGEYSVSVERHGIVEYSLAKAFTITVGPRVDYPILDAHIDLKPEDPNYRWGSKVWISNPAADCAGNKVDDVVTMSVYVRPVGGGEEIRLCSFGEVPVPSTSKSSFFLQNSLYPLQGEYEIYMRYTIPGGERGILNPCEKSRINIVPNEQDWMYVPKLTTTLPTLYASENLPKGTEQIISVPLTNTGENDFKGTYTATFYCKETGDFIEKTFEGVSLKKGESTTVEVPVTFKGDGLYEMQFFTKQNPGYNMMTFNTFVTDAGRRPLHMYVGVGTTAVESATIPNVHVYPNPATEWISLSGIEKPTEITVYSMGGTKAAAYTVLPGGRTDVSRLPAGLYLVSTPHGVSKLIKK